MTLPRANVTMLKLNASNLNAFVPPTSFGSTLFRSSPLNLAYLPSYLKGIENKILDYTFKC